jgi:hypothetical protein
VSGERAAAALVAALVGGAACPIIVLGSWPLWWLVRALLSAAGVRFDDSDDYDRSSRALTAATWAVSVAIGIAGAVISCGFVLAHSIGRLDAAGVIGGAVAGIAVAVFGSRGMPGMRGTPIVISAIASGAAAAAITAAIT